MKWAKEFHIDDKDQKILFVLQQDSSLSTNEISELTGIPQTTVHNRIRKLKENHVIQGFTIKINRKAIGKGLVAFILCTVSYRTQTGDKISQIDVARQICQFPEVEEAAIVTGEIDLIVKVSVRDVDALNDFLITKLRDLEGVEKTVTSVVLSEV
jgi:Lrp/AsnC family transcriptional regulator for asnA, asnC and gidA